MAGGKELPLIKVGDLSLFRRKTAAGGSLRLARWLSSTVNSHWSLLRATTALSEFLELGDRDQMKVDFKRREGP